MSKRVRTNPRYSYQPRPMLGDSISIVQLTLADPCDEREVHEKAAERQRSLQRELEGKFPRPATLKSPFDFDASEFVEVPNEPVYA